MLLIDCLRDSLSEKKNVIFNMFKSFYFLGHSLYITEYVLMSYEKV